MEPIGPQVVNYNDDHFQALLAEFKALTTYESVRAWDQKASAEIDRIVTLMRGIREQITRLEGELETARKTHSEKSFFGRLASGRNAEREAEATIERYRNYLVRLDKMASELQESIDFSPDNTDEQKSLLKELRLHKKELQLQKRELKEGMKAIREEARQKSVTAGKFLWSYDSKIAAYERRQIRYKREQAIRPQEDARVAIERQLIEVDRDILWAERFRS